MEKKEIRERLYKYLKGLGFEESSGLELMLPDRYMDYEDEKVEDEVLDFISQELDKAREEGRREVFTKEELECILKWKDACDGEFNCLSLLPSSGEDWGKEEDIESAEEKLRDLLDKLKDKK